MHVSTSGNTERHTFAVTSRGVQTQVSLAGIRSDSHYRADAALAWTLVPAMAAASSLELADPVSPRLLDAVSTIQAILSAWYDDLSIVDVAAEARTVTEEERPAGTAAFFSGGVDSFFTLLKHADELSHLIFVHGLDISLDDHSLRERAGTAARETASEFGLELVELETDVRKLSNGRIDWGVAHGPVLAGIGLLAQGVVSKVFIPATDSYRDLFPSGSHPLLDPLWGTERVTFVHDGCEATRVAKVARIAESETALEHLRVCWLNHDGEYNCGRCEKCVRTMISLEAVDALDRCKTFPQRLEPSALRSFVIDQGTRAFAQENLLLLRSSGAHPQLAAALERALRNSTGWRRPLAIGRSYLQRAPGKIGRTIGSLRLQ